MKKIILLFFLSIALTTSIKAQFYSLKTNLIGLATTNLNIEGAVSVHRNWSLHLPINYNPWIFGKNRIQNITIEPGARYWFLESFSQSFLGIYSLYSRYHVGGWNKYRYDGYGVGAGLSYGYSKVLNKYWNIEFEAGIALIWTDYTKYLCKSCGAPQGDFSQMRLVPGKAAISLVYLF